MGTEDSSEATGRIRFTKMPAGEAPEWVREAWVGVEVPCLPISGPSSDGHGVLSRERRDQVRDVFTVPQKEALDALEAVHPEAAAWWRDRGFPLDEPDDLFEFGTDEAEVISGVREQEITWWNDFDGDPRK